MSTQGDLLSWTPPARDAFGGATYEPEIDYSRLVVQSRQVFDLMKDGRWRTISEIAEQTRNPSQSVSARLRDFRKEKFGGHTVERERVCGGTYQYRLIVKKKQEAA